MSLVSSAGSMSGDSGPTPFLFPQTKSRGLPDPSNFFSPDLLSSPLPTHSFFHNFVVEKGKGAAYIHPYLISFSASTLYISYPRVSANSTRITGSSSDSLEIRTRWGNTTTHRVSSFSDISVTVDFPLDNVSFFLCRGSPFVTCDVAKDTQLYIFTHSEILRAFNSPCLIKHTIELSNGNTWLLYFSSPIDISHGYSTIRTSLFSGIIRIALLPDSNPLFEEILDRFYSCYPVSGTAEITKKFCIEYKWETEAEGDLLMLAHPLHLRLLSLSDCTVIVLENFKYNSIDGELVGVVGDSWVLKSNDDPLSVTWHSLKGINEESRPEICNALENDVEVVCSVKTSTRSIHSYGKLIAKAARFAMIAEEVPYKSVIPQITRFLKDKIEPWLDGTYNSNGFLYDRIWGGIVMREESEDYLDSRGFGLSHAHHFHVGYFLYAIAVLAKIDVEWGSKYRPQTYSLISDFMNLVRSGETDKSSSNNYYPRLRCFDLWKLHSWSGGLSYYAVERYLDSVGEALNAYYSATLIGLVYGDTNLVELGSMLSAMEIYSAKTWCHVREEQNTYAHEFSTYNRMVVKSWSSERLSPQKYSGSMKEYSLQEQVLPLLPITEVLLSDIGYVKELVEWILQDVFATGDPGEEGRGVVCALEAIYDKEIALHKVNKLKRFADGNSFTNILWWIHSRMPSPFSSSPSTSGNSMSLFTYEELSKATDEFSKANWLGEGGFGTVYKGFLADGKAVAIKQLKNCGEQGKLQFQAEVEIINRTHHPRLVSLVGYCISEHHRLLIYDYVPNGTLDDHLHDHFRPVMAWANRVRVAIGAARGITYLHEDCYPRIIHRDIKSSNILLDYNFDPKARPFLMQQPPNDEDFEKLVDSKLENNFVKSEMLQMIKVATACVTHSDSERPQMIQVLEDLAALMSSNQT